MDAEIKEGESWLTILMAVLFVRGGISSIAMALTSPVPLPQFGFQPSLSFSAAICASTGALSVFIGFLLFKLSRAGHISA